MCNLRKFDLWDSVFFDYLWYILLDCVSFFFLGFWVFVNNVGIDSFGDVEFCIMDMYCRVVEVNLFGMV